VDLRVHGCPPPLGRWARTTGIAGAWLERDEAILVNLREADEYAHAYVVPRVRSSLTGRRAGECAGKRLFPRNNGNCNPIALPAI
jgi:hypothetical protein